MNIYQVMICGKPYLAKDNRLDKSRLLACGDDVAVRTIDGIVGASVVDGILAMSEVEEQTICRMFNQPTEALPIIAEGRVVAQSDIERLVAEIESMGYWPMFARSAKRWVVSAYDRTTKAVGDIEGDTLEDALRALIAELPLPFTG
jgi:hypothetical protein